MKVILRKARLRDASKIFSMINELENGALDRRKGIGVFRRNLENPTIHYMVASYGGSLVGFVSMHIQELLHHAGKVAEIQELYVDPKTRGVGIGKKLVENMRLVAKKKNCDSFEVTTNIKRKRAQNFYIVKAGMRRTHYKFTSPLQS